MDACQILVQGTTWWRSDGLRHQVTHLRFVRFSRDENFSLVRPVEPWARRGALWHTTINAKRYVHSTVRFSPVVYLPTSSLGESEMASPPDPSLPSWCFPHPRGLTSRNLHGSASSSLLPTLCSNAQSNRLFAASNSRRRNREYRRASEVSGSCWNTPRKQPCCQQSLAAEWLVPMGNGLNGPF